MNGGLTEAETDAVVSRKYRGAQSNFRNNLENHGEVH